MSSAIVEGGPVLRLAKVWPSWVWLWLPILDRLERRPIELLGKPLWHHMPKPSFTTTLKYSEQEKTFKLPNCTMPHIENNVFLAK